MSGWLVTACGRGSARSPALTAPTSPGTRRPGFRRSAGASALRLAGIPLQLAGFEEPENRQHPPVLGCALRQVELGQDAADVFLDRALGDEDPAGDARVGRALGHEGEHVAFTRRQDIEWITPPASPDELLHQG